MEGVSLRVELPQLATIHVRRYGPTDDEWQPPSTSPSQAPPPVLICVHGAGMSSMSFGPVAAIISAAQVSDEHPFACRVVSIDLPCHGDSANGPDAEAGLTLDNIVAHFVATVAQLKCSIFPKTERFYYAGHSLGGSVVAFGATNSAIASFLGGVVMLDIVENVAKLSLRYMNSVLDKRPTSFVSLREAAHWFVTHGGMYNESIAQLTTPYLLRQDGEHGPFFWRTDLRKTERCWSSWFEGLDKRFVTLTCPKMLLLAATDRLDNELTTAHMQGKFQLEVVGTQGHYVMEDEPTIVAAKLMRFICRVDLLSAKLSLINRRLNTQSQ
jgi:protein phosphatase methylesterase 1